MKLTIPVIIVSSFLSLATFPALSAKVDIKVPFRYAKGKVLYEKSCASCHGNTLQGSASGPPLLHAFYKPDHHGDQAFYNAGLKGVKAHHWRFGDMPAIAGMTAKKMNSIVSYIRFYQQQKKLF